MPPFGTCRLGFKQRLARLRRRYSRLARQRRQYVVQVLAAADEAICAYRESLGANASEEGQTLWGRKLIATAVMVRQATQLNRGRVNSVRSQRKRQRRLDDQLANIAELLGIGQDRLHEECDYVEAEWSAGRFG